VTGGSRWQSLVSVSGLSCYFIFGVTWSTGLESLLIDVMHTRFDLLLFSYKIYTTGLLMMISFHRICSYKSYTPPSINRCLKFVKI
jgi:fatty-acid desaturase